MTIPIAYLNLRPTRQYDRVTEQEMRAALANYANLRGREDHRTGPLYAEAKHALYELGKRIYLEDRAKTCKDPFKCSCSGRLATPASSTAGGGGGR